MNPDCRLSRQRGTGQNKEQGYILLVLFLMAALIAIGLMRAFPKAFVETQREREEETIFRGQQYQRAIQFFVRKFGRYPNSLEELEETNKVRFLRRRYRDPLTKERDLQKIEQDVQTKERVVQTTEGGWRLIHIGPGGVFIDAKTTIGFRGAAASQSGLNPSTGGTGLEPSPEMPRPGIPSSQAPGGPGGMFGSASPFPGGAQATGQSGTQLTGASGQPREPALSPSANPGANPAQQPRAAASVLQGSAQPAFGGGGIAGVASQNTEKSIKVWNGYSQHDEWEFVYDFRTDPLGLAAIARVSGAVAQPAALQPTPGQPPATGPQPTTPGFPPTPFPQPSPFPGSSPAPGVRPTPPAFPPSPIPGTTPYPPKP